MLGLTRGARADRHGYQVVRVEVRDGYHPNRIEARAGVPLRIVFDRRDSDPCSERVVFSDPRVERRLAPDTATEVILPVPQEGRIRFTCAMGRYHGTIVVRPSRWPRAARLLHRPVRSTVSGGSSMAPHTQQHASVAPRRRRLALSRTQRWVSVLVVLGGVAAVLVMLGVISASSALFLGAFGGMMLMHLGGHGMHGGHDGHGAQAGPGSDPDSGRVGPDGHDATEVRHARSDATSRR